MATIDTKGTVGEPNLDKSLKPQWSQQDLASLVKGVPTLARACAHFFSDQNLLNWQFSIMVRRTVHSQTFYKKIYCSFLMTCYNSVSEVCQLKQTPKKLEWISLDKFAKPCFTLTPFRLPWPTVLFRNKIFILSANNVKNWLIHIYKNASLRSACYTSPQDMYSISESMSTWYDVMLALGACLCRKGMFRSRPMYLCQHCTQHAWWSVGST